MAPKHKKWPPALKLLIPSTDFGFTMILSDCFHHNTHTHTGHGLEDAMPQRVFSDPLLSSLPRFPPAAKWKSWTVDVGTQEEDCTSLNRSRCIPVLAVFTLPCLWKVKESVSVQSDSQGARCSFATTVYKLE
uniref:Uncharacterized protein n=1 Tax=Eutreptiella gymnastica TaxID=73025 RepID=A0A7S1NKQ4_9EUGL